MRRTKLPQVPIAFIQVEDMTNVALAELSVITILASLSADTYNSYSFIST